MAWSECANGRMGPVKDSNHRISISISATEIDLHPHDVVDKLIRLASHAHESMHLFVDLQLGDVSESGAIDLFNDFRSEFIQKWKMSIRNTITDALFLTVLCSQYLSPENFDSLLPSTGTLNEFMKVNLLIIPCSPSIEGTIQNVSAFSKMYKTNLQLGLTLPSDDQDLFKLQLIIEGLPSNCIEVVYFGNIQHPSLLEIHKLDFIHSRGLNSMITIPEKYLLELSYPSSAIKSQLLTRLAGNYGKFEVAVLAKVLVQIGYMVALEINGGTSEDMIWDRFLFMVHPFIYRLAFVSPTNVYAFNVSLEDVTAMCDASEDLESAWVEQYLPLSTDRASVIPKTDLVGLS